MLIIKHFSALIQNGFRPGLLLHHICQKLATLTVGRIFVSRWGRWVRSIASSYASPHENITLKLAILGHAYYPELIPEMIACRQELLGFVPVHLTVPSDKMRSAEAQVQGIEGVTLHPCFNRGRDIGPFVQLLNSGLLNDYDAVLKIHTKRSPHLLDGELRRKLLFSMLCGDKHAAARALAAFECPDTGLVGWAASWRSNPVYWMGNRTRVSSLSRKMNADRLNNCLGFFEGSMFWFRPAALAAVKELQLSADDFEIEAGQVDGTLHHALERCFTIAAWSKGYVVRDLKGRILSPKIDMS